MGLKPNMLYYRQSFLGCFVVISMIKSVQLLKNLAGKTVLLRVDFNVENPRETTRLQRSLPTIKYLLAQRARVVLVSHRGRPDGGVVPELSLKPLVPFLRRRASASIFLFDHFNFGHIRAQIAASRPGSLFMIENIRFLSGEEADATVNQRVLAQQLAMLGDYYVNDAFAVNHHPAASLTELPKLLPAYAGFLVLEETEQLNRVIKHATKPLVVVIGGGKAEDKFKVIKNLHRKAAYFLVGGVLANTFLRMKGVDVGYSSIDASLADQVRRALKDKKIILPVDWVVSDKGKIVDIGPRTALLFGDVIKKARTVIWNGPMGIFENPKYRAGTAAVAKAIAKSKAFSIVGGGETVQFIDQSHMADKFDFLSTGGGAMLQMLGGKKLPGIEALK
jgi:phosphoglycerate kinase